MKLTHEKILIVNDIAGAGKVAGNVVFPMLSAAALEPAILPTLLLSTNADAPGNVATLSTHAAFTRFLAHWEELGFEFSAFATGYFAEVEQIIEFTEYFLKEKEKNTNKKLFVDPTMGEHGELYPGFNEEVPTRIGHLIQHADIVLPNITEACLLTGHPYKEPMDFDEMSELAKKVSQLGAKNTILSGIQKKDENGKEQIGFFYYDEDGNSGLLMHEYFEQHFFGAGDVVFSAIISFYLKGLSIYEAIEKTSQLTEKALQDTIALDRNEMYGIYFEPMLADFMKELAEID